MSERFVDAMTSREAVKLVKGQFPTGTRLLCVKNGKTYQMGVKAEKYSFWLFCETDSTKGRVDAVQILGEFTKVAE